MLLVCFLLVSSLVFLSAFGFCVMAVLGIVWQVDNVLLCATIGVVSLLFSVIGFYLAFMRRSRQEQTFTVLSTENGQVLLSGSAINAMAQRVVSRHQDIKDVQTVIAQSEGGLCIRVKASVAGDVQVPALASELQTEIREYVSETGGIAVKEVLVFFDRVHPVTVPTPSRVH